MLVESSRFRHNLTFLFVLLSTLIFLYILLRSFLLSHLAFYMLLSSVSGASLQCAPWLQLTSMPSFPHHGSGACLTDRSYVLMVLASFRPLRWLLWLCVTLWRRLCSFFGSGVIELILSSSWYIPVLCKCDAEYLLLLILIFQQADSLDRIQTHNLYLTCKYMHITINSWIE